MKPSRRRFLQFSMGAAGAFLFTPINWKLMDDVAIWTQNWSWVPVPEDGARAYTTTTCRICNGGCGIKVRLIDGKRAVKIEGNPESPINRGGLCAWGAAGLQYLYMDENRVPGPMKRDRVTGVRTRLTWEAALELAAAELKKAGGEGTAIVNGRKRSTMNGLIRQFAADLGAAHYCEPWDGGDVQKAASELLLGRPGRYGFDLERAQVILSFNAALLEGWASPVRMMRAFGTWMSGPEDSRARLFQVDPRASLTASKADTWLPAKPGTETIVALAMANVMIAGNMVAPEAAEAPGFEQFKSLAEAYSPSKAAELTGVEADQIREAAEAFAKAERAVALSGQGHGNTPEPLSLAWAVLALNGLKGNFNKEGGVYLTPEPPGLDLGAGVENGSLLELAKGVAQGKEKLSALLLFESNPLFNGPDPAAMAELMDKTPLVISFSPFWDESTQKADLILPDLTYLERWDDVDTPLGMPYQAVSVTKPIFAPRHKGAPTGDVVAKLTKALGKTPPFAKYEDALKARVAELQATGHGLAASEEPAAPMDLLGPGPGKGWGSAEEAFEEVAATGLWYNPSGQGDQVTLSFEKTLEVKPLEPKGDAQHYPYPLVVFDTARVASGFYANPPFVTKIIEDDFLLKKDIFINIHPETAHALHLKEGSKVVLESETGQGWVGVHLTQGARPGVIYLPAGLGHTTFDPTLKDKGLSGAAMVEAVEDPHNGQPLTFLGRAKLRKA